MDKLYIAWILLMTVLFALRALAVNWDSDSTVHPPRDPESGSDPIEREALRLARQEVAEIEWQAGLGPKPRHLDPAERSAPDPFLAELQEAMARPVTDPRSVIPILIRSQTPETIR